MQQNILEQYISPLIKSIILSDIDGVVILKHDTTDIIEEKPLSATFHLSSSHLSKLFTLKTRAFIFAYYPDHVIAQCDCGTGLVLTILGDLSVKEGTSAITR